MVERPATAADLDIKARAHMLPAATARERWPTIRTPSRPISAFATFGIRHTALAQRFKEGSKLRGDAALGQSATSLVPLFGNSLVDGNACFEHPWPNLTCLSPQKIRAGLAIAVISTVGTRSELVDRIEV
jgi:hypothetical protein